MINNYNKHLPYYILIIKALSKHTFNYFEVDYL